MQFDFPGSRKKNKKTFMSNELGASFQKVPKNYMN